MVKFYIRKNFTKIHKYKVEAGVLSKKNYLSNYEFSNDKVKMILHEYQDDNFEAINIFLKDKGKFNNKKIYLSYNGKRCDFTYFEYDNPKSKIIEVSRNQIILMINKVFREIKLNKILK